MPELAALLERPLLTLERIRVCKRDGAKLAEPRHVPETDPSGLGVWQKLMVYAGEQSRHGGRPLHHALVRALREAPVVTVIVDTQRGGVRLAEPPDPAS